MDTFLGQALTDPATGLPNLPFFRLIHSWEERKAERRDTQVCAVHIHVRRGSDLLRRALMVRLCREIRASDLMASEGRNDLWVLLTTPDAEHVEMIAQRVAALVDEVNRSLDGGADHVDRDDGPENVTRDDDERLVVETDVRAAMGNDYWSLVR